MTPFRCSGHVAEIDGPQLDLGRSVCPCVRSAVEYRSRNPGGGGATPDPGFIAALTHPAGVRCAVGRVARYGGLLAVAAALVVTTAGAAGAVDAVPLPMKGPPGANVSVNVTNCPAGTTETIAVRLRIASSSPLPFDPAEPGVVVVPATEPTVVVPFRVPIDANPGAYAFDVFCLGAGNTVVDGPATVPFEVALLPVRVTPNQGPLGTQITVSGSGCPTGVTDVVAVRIEGASDDVPLWDPAAPDAFRFSTPPAADGSFSIAFAVPSDLPPGENSVQVFCISEGGSNLAGPGFGLFIVTEGTVSTAPLPRTGGYSAGLFVAGTALVLVGLLYTRGARFRRFER